MAYIGFLVGFIGSAPFAWGLLAEQLDAGRFARGLWYFFGIVTTAGIFAGIVGLGIGAATGVLWEQLHRHRRHAKLNQAERLAAAERTDAATDVAEGAVPERSFSEPPRLQLVSTAEARMVSGAGTISVASPFGARPLELDLLGIRGKREDEPNDWNDRMTQELWTTVDRYIVDALSLADPVLEAAQEASDAAGLPAIQVSAAQGRFLEIVARMQGARRILEIGTLGGYSTIWMARALSSGGKLVTLEVDPKHAEVAVSNFERAGLADRIEMRLGGALDTLPRLAQERAGPFDLVFIDADKASIPAYFDWSLRMSRPGTVIIVDNVVREGAVIDAESADASVQGVRRLNELMASDPRIISTVLQTVGVKGYDGFAVALVK